MRNPDVTRRGDSHVRSRTGTSVTTARVDCGDTRGQLTCLDSTANLATATRCRIVVIAGLGTSECTFTLPGRSNI